MKYSYKTLKQFVPRLQKLAPNTLIDILSTRLSEVEQIEDLSLEYQDLLVAKVLDIKKHPNSDKLYVVTLDIGFKQVVVVAGAGNMKVGDFVPYTPVGVKVPRNAYPERFDGIVRKIKLAGIDSEGMLNSEFELKISDNHSEILILKQNELGPLAPNLKPGLRLDEILGFNDHLIEIENKSMTHRGDVFSHLGLANELGAILDVDVNRELVPFFNTNTVQELQPYKGSSLNIRLGNVNKGALRYRLVFIDLGKPLKDLPESPLWLKVFLSKFGVNPINVVVDLTNYIALMYGQPMHAFDFDKLQNFNKQGNKQHNNEVEITVDYVNSGEFQALDDKIYKISHPTLCILADNKPIAFAGVIGGKQTAVDKNTTRILLEIATFSYSDIRRTTMLYGLNTLASIIYSRQQAVDKVEFTSATFVDLLRQFVDVQEVGVTNDISNVSDTDRNIKVKLSYLLKIIPIKGLNSTIIEDVLRRLRFKIDKLNTNTLFVYPPADRTDINIKEDLVEEIVRIIGYEQLIVSLPKSSPVSVLDDFKVLLRTKLSSDLISKGYVERVGLGFISQKIVEKLKLQESRLYHIKNAVSPDVNFYRPFIAVQALDSIRAGLSYADFYGTFEIGHTAMKLKPEELNYAKKGARDQSENLNNAKMEFFDILDFKHNLPYPNEYVHLNLMLASRDYSFTDLLLRLKTDLAWIINSYNLDIIPTNRLQRSDKLLGYDKWNMLINMLNQYNSGFIIHNNRIIGILGGISSVAKTAISLPANIAIAELELDELIRLRPHYTVNSSSRFTPVTQDFTFVVSDNTSFYSFKKDLQSQVKVLQQDIGGSFRFLWDITDIFDSGNFYTVTVRFRFIPNKKVRESDIKSVRSRLIQLMEQAGYKLKGE